MAANPQDLTLSTHRMRVSRNGQVSIPAAARRRWGQSGREMLVVDLGDRIIMRPASAAPVDELCGKHAGLGPSVDEARAADDADDLAREERRRR